MIIVIGNGLNFVLMILAFSASFEYLCYGSMAIIIFLLNLMSKDVEKCYQGWPIVAMSRIQATDKVKMRRVILCDKKLFQKLIHRQATQLNGRDAKSSKSSLGAHFFEKK